MYYRWHRAVRQTILDRGTCLVAVDSEEPDYLWGYICFEPIKSDLVVHWTYVRSSERRQRVGYRLLAEALAWYPDAERVLTTHRTWFASHLDKLSITLTNFAELDYEIK